MSKLQKIAEIMGYDEIRWDSENKCFSGYGSTNPYAEVEPTLAYFVAWNHRELDQIMRQAVCV